MAVVITNIRWGSSATLNRTNEAPDTVLNVIIYFVPRAIYRSWKLDSQERQQDKCVRASASPCDRPHFLIFRGRWSAHVRDGKINICKTWIECEGRRPRVRRLHTKEAYILYVGLGVGKINLHELHVDRKGKVQRIPSQTNSLGKRPLRLQDQASCHGFRYHSEDQTLPQRQVHVR